MKGFWEAVMNILEYIAVSLLLGCFPIPTVSSPVIQTPYGCPAIQFTSDANHLESGFDSPGLKAQSHKTAPTSGTSCSSQPPGLATCEGHLINCL